MKTKNTRHSELVSESSLSSPCISDKSGIPWNEFRVAKQEKRTRDFHGFTLVELIVVITILVILGTIAFLNIGGFSSSARDSSRISNLTNLKKGLDIYQTKNGTYPMPEGPLNILASWSIIGYQWFAKDTVGGLANLSVWGTVDPSDSSIYTTYAVSYDQKKMQVMSFLEDGSNATAFAPLLVPTASAGASSDYGTRTPTTQGDALGILLGNSGSSLNQPVQERYDANAFTGVDVVNTNSGYTAVFGNGKSGNISGTGLALSQLQNTIVTGGSRYPGCDTYDIAIGNQVWSACNAGASVANTDTGTTVSGTTVGSPTWYQRYGAYYQWGRNVDVTTATGFTGPVSVDGGTGFIISTGGDWLTTKNDNLWWGAGTSPISGTYTSQWKPSAMQGPCAAGYHVPTQKEWCDAVLSVSPNLTCNSVWQSETINSLFRITLKLPLLGNRSVTDGSFTLQGTNGRYWASSPNTTNIGNTSGVNISSTQVNPSANTNRGHWFPVRCLKN